MKMPERKHPLLLIMIITCVITASCSKTPSAVQPNFALDNSIQASQASSYVGERTIVCGKVTKTHYARAVNGSPTFLNLGDQDKTDFTIVIWGKDRSNFSDFPEVMYDNQNLCVRGLILSFEGTAEMQLKSPSDVQVTH